MAGREGGSVPENGGRCGKLDSPVLIQGRSAASHFWACRRERGIPGAGPRVLLSEDTWLGAHWGSGDGEVPICPVCLSKMTHEEELCELWSQAAQPVVSVPACVLVPSAPEGSVVTY